MIKIGIVDLDSSHSPNFVKRVNHIGIEDEQWVEGAKVVAAYPGCSPITEREKFEEYKKVIKDCGVEMVDSPEGLLGKVDAVMIESVDGTRHFSPAKMFIEKGIPAFVDKPFTSSLEEAISLAEMAKKNNVPLFSASSLRYVPEVIEVVEKETVGKIIAVDVITPCRANEKNPGLFNYGIHGVEMLFTFLGSGCEFVQTVGTEYGQVVTAQWRDGRLGMVRAYDKGAGGFGFFVIGDKDNLHKMASEKYIYRELLKKIIKMFETKTPPLNIKITLEIIAFIEAALESLKEGKKIFLEKNIIDSI